VQAAKIVHRLASGTHKKWSRPVAGATELHVYPASRGQVLRHIGADLKKAVELLADRAVPAVAALAKNVRPATRPTPRKLAVRRQGR